jgi:hypothetical protein
LLYFVVGAITWPTRTFRRVQMLERTARTKVQRTDSSVLSVSSSYLQTSTTTRHPPTYLTVMTSNGNTLRVRAHISTYQHAGDACFSSRQDTSVLQCTLPRHSYPVDVGTALEVLYILLW